MTYGRPFPASRRRFYDCAACAFAIFWSMRKAYRGQERKNQVELALSTGGDTGLLHAGSTGPPGGINPMLTPPPSPSSHDEGALANLSSCTPSRPPPMLMMQPTLGRDECTRRSCQWQEVDLVEGLDGRRPAGSQRRR